MKTLILRGKKDAQLNGRLVTIYHNQFGRLAQTNRETSKTIWTYIKNPSENFPYTIDNLLAVIEHDLITPEEEPHLFYLLESDAKIRKFLQEFLFDLNEIVFTDELKITKDEEEIEARVKLTHENALRKLQLLFIKDQKFFKRLFEKCPAFIASLSIPALKKLMRSNFQAMVLLCSSSKYGEKIAATLSEDEVFDLLTVHLDGNDDLVKFVTIFQYIIKYRQLNLMNVMKHLVENRNHANLPAAKSKILKLFYNSAPMEPLAIILKNYPDLFLLLCDKEADLIFDLISLSLNPIDFLNTMVKKQNDIKILIADNIVFILTALYRSNAKIDDQEVENFLKKNYVVDNGKKKYFADLLADKILSLLPVLHGKESLVESELQSLMTLFDKNYIRNLIPISKENIQKMINSAYPSYCDRIICEDEKFWKLFVELYQEHRKTTMEAVSGILRGYPRFIRAKLMLAETFEALISGHKTKIDDHSAYLLVHSKTHWNTIKKKLAPEQFGKNSPNILFYLKTLFEKGNHKSKNFTSFIISYCAYNKCPTSESFIYLFCSLASGPQILACLVEQNQRFSQEMGAYQTICAEKEEYREVYNESNDFCKVVFDVIVNDAYFLRKIAYELSADNINLFARFLPILIKLTSITSLKISHLIIKTTNQFDCALLEKTLADQPALFVKIFEQNKPKILKKLADTHLFVKVLGLRNIYQFLAPEHCLQLLNLNHLGVNAVLKGIFEVRPKLLQDLLDHIKEPISSPKNLEGLFSILETANWLDKLTLEQLIKLKALHRPSLFELTKKHVAEIAQFGMQAPYAPYILDVFGSEFGGVLVLELLDQVRGQLLSDIWKETTIIQHHLSHTKEPDRIDNQKLLKLLKVIKPELNQDVLAFIKKHPSLFVRLLKDTSITAQLDTISEELKELAESPECGPKINFIDLTLVDYLRLLKLKQKALPNILVKIITDYTNQTKDHRAICELICEKDCDDYILNLFEATLVNLLNNELFVNESLCQSSYQVVITKLISDKQEVLQSAMVLAASADVHRAFTKKILNLACDQQANKTIHRFASENPKIFYNLLAFAKESEQASEKFTYEELQFLMGLDNKQIYLGIFNNKWFCSTWVKNSTFTKLNLPVILELLVANQAQWFLTDELYKPVQTLLEDHIKNLFYDSDADLNFLLKLIKNKNCLDLFSNLETPHLNKLIALGGDEVVEVIFSPEFRSTKQRANLFYVFALKCITNVANKKVIERCFEDQYVNSIAFHSLTPEQLTTFLISSPMASSPELVNRLFLPQYNVDFEQFIKLADNFALFKGNKFFAREIIHRYELLKLSKFYNNEDLVELLLDKEFTDTLKYLLADNPSELFLKLLKNSYDWMPEEIKQQISFIIPKEFIVETSNLVKSWEIIIRTEEDNNNAEESPRKNEKYYPKNQNEQAFRTKTLYARSEEKKHKAKALQLYSEADKIECANKDKLYHYLGLAGHHALKLKIVHLSLELNAQNKLPLLIEFLKNFQGKMTVDLLPIQVLYIEGVLKACQQQANLNPNLIFDYLSSLNLDPKVLMKQIDQLELEELVPAVITAQIESLLKLLLKNYASIASDDALDKFLRVLSQYIRFYQDDFQILLNQDTNIKDQIYHVVNKHNLLSKYFSKIEEAKLKLYLLKAMILDLQKSKSTQTVLATKVLVDYIVLLEKRLIDDVLKEKKLRLKPAELITLADSQLIVYFLRNEQYTHDLSAKDLVELSLYIRQPNLSYFIYPHLFKKLSKGELLQLANRALYDRVEEMLASVENSPLFARFKNHWNLLKEDVVSIKPKEEVVEKTAAEEKIILESKSVSSIGDSTKVMLTSFKEKNVTPVNGNKPTTTSGDRSALWAQIQKGTQLKSIKENNNENKSQHAPAFKELKILVPGFSNDFIRGVCKNLNVNESTSAKEFITQLQDVVMNDKGSELELNKIVEEIANKIDTKFRQQFLLHFNAKNIMQIQEQLKNNKVQNSVPATKNIFDSIVTSINDRRKNMKEESASSDDESNDAERNTEWQDNSTNGY